MKPRIALLVSLLLGLGICAQAQTDRARVADAHGTVQKRSSPADTRVQPVSIGDLLLPESVVRTGPDSAALLILPDKHNFRIGERAEVHLKELGQSKSYSFEVIRGQIWSFVDKAGKPAKYEVETPSTVLGVSGTLFSVSHNAQTTQSEVTVADGQVSVRQGSMVHQVGKGYMLRLRRGQTAPAMVEKHDAGTKKMWDHLQKTENWTTKNANPKISQDSESELRAIQAERQQEQQRLQNEKKQLQEQKQERQKQNQKKTQKHTPKPTKP
jgi:hypothetical protein